METPQRPAYIYRGGGGMFHPPSQLDNCLMYSFFVKGQLKKIQGTIDQCLNAVAGNKYRFKALSEYMMLTFTNIEKDYSTNPKDIDKGWAAEIDTSIWIPVGSIIEKDGKEYLDDFFWFTPYIWVDNSLTIPLGRELYGYPKGMGKFELPSADQPDFFKATVNGFKTYNREEQAQWHELLTVTNTNPGDGPAQKWDNFVDALTGIWDVAKGTQLFRPDMDVVEEVIKTLLKPQIPQIFLKQTPDGKGERAVYQGLVTAPAIINEFHSGGILNGEYQLNIQDIASEPLARDLGLSLGKQEVAFGFYLNYNFLLDDAEEIVNNSVTKPQKVAVLGGGVSSCVAAFELTSQPGWQDRYDITLYQQGWRIGGKGASGRNSKLGERIEEHGLHIWFGFYRNAFRVIQEAYKEMNLPADAPLSTWEKAFHPQNFITAMEHIEGEWIPWYLEFPYKDGNPGEGKESLSPWQLVETMYAWIKKWLGDLRGEIKKIDKPDKPEPKIKAVSFRDRLKAFAHRLEEEVEETVDEIEDAFHDVLEFFDELPETISELNAQDGSWLKSISEDIKEWIDEMATEYLNDHTEIRRLYIAIDLGLAVIHGMLKDDMFEKGFDVANDVNFNDWLRINGANEEFTVKSAIVRAVYDLIFSYQDGDATLPNLEAGTALRGVLRLGICYKGGVMWKMQAGMGDTIFTPFYEVLKARGVKFKYFHEVDELKLDKENPRLVDEISIIKQVKLADEATDYNPIVTVKDLGCWPSEPKYDLIDPEQAKLLQDNKVDLESFWSNWPGVYEKHYGKALPKITLKRGQDFDIVINGISIASQPYICPQLLDHSKALRESHDNIATSVTQAYQLWTDPNLKELGWTHFPDGEEPVLGAWTEPVDTWAAMNQLLDKEDWSELGIDPKNVAYYCGVQPITEIPPRTDLDFPARSKKKVKDAAIAQMKEVFYTIWPNAATDGSFNWDVLTDIDNQSGEDRFDAQYWRSNISPSERYVQSVVGSTKYRIHTKLEDFDNIYFTGDWIKNGINAGCVEAATMAGLETSRAICGYPKIIKGEHDFGDPDL